MISLLRRLPGNLRSSSVLFVNITASSPVKGLAAKSNRYISTSENVGKSAQRTGGLRMDLMNKRLLNKSSRPLSTLPNHSAPTAAHLIVSQDERRDFMSIFPEIIRDLTEITSIYNPNETLEWFARVLDYNLTKAKKSRALLTILTYKSLVKSKDCKPDNMRLAYIVGWCFELLHAFFVVNDDVMDNGITRNGQLCWHKVENVGLMAINDALLMENTVYAILKKYFRNTDCYVELLELFHEITFMTTCGQNLDSLNAEKPLTTFTMEKYNTTARNKTSFYTLYLPFAVAMHLAGIKDPEAFRQSKAILLEIGHFHQIENDFLDCFSNPDITGKTGNDIECNRCSWLALACMQRANDQQKQIMLDCYGKNDPEKVQKVVELYKSLDLPNTYAVYAEESYNMIKTRIQETSCGVPHEIFLHILNKIYKRGA